MLFHIRMLLIGLAAIAIFCTGCGGGGGGTPGNDLPPTPVTLGLSATAPDLTGKVGQSVSIPVSITGSGTITTASMDISVSDAAFEPVATRAEIGGASVEIDGLPADAAACYKWVDARTIRVLYSSATGASGGSVLVDVPVKVKSESAGAPAVSHVLINQ